MVQLCVITGAGSGIGRAFAQLWTAHGNRAILVGRRADKLEETAELCREKGPEGCAIVCARDITGKGVAEDVIRLAGSVDLLLNNAGMTSLRGVTEWDDGYMEQLLAVNFLAPARLTRAAWPSLTERRGCVINVSSVAVIDPFFGNGFYGATKSALDGLTRAIHKEGSTAGVRSFSLAAGSVETDMLRSIADESVLPKNKDHKL